MILLTESTALSPFWIRNCDIGDVDDQTSKAIGNSCSDAIWRTRLLVRRHVCSGIAVDSMPGTLDTTETQIPQNGYKPPAPTSS